MRLPAAWTADDRLARAAWTRLTEPGDLLAGAVVSALGAGPALARVASGQQLTGECVDPEAVGPDDRGRAARRLAAASDRWRARLDQLAPERDLATVERLGGRLLVPGDEEWPERLADLDLGEPLALWVLGPLDLAATVQLSVAVVGSRAASAYGEHVTGEIAAGVVDRGLSVVSGGAFGVDAVAHRAALAAGGRTVAVLACGVDRYYPKAHEGLLRRVAAEGLVVAEVAPGSMPMRSRFLERNRVIAAMAGGTVVVEAAWRSGALRTASVAAELGRPLGAVPGPVTSATSAGCHRLIRDVGATCVTGADEVAELVRPVGSELPEPPPVLMADHDGLSEGDLRVLDALPVRRGAPVERLVAVAGLTRPEVEAGLGRLHMLGLGERLTGADGPVWRRAAARREAAPLRLAGDGSISPR